MNIEPTGQPQPITSADNVVEVTGITTDNAIDATKNSVNRTSLNLDTETKMALDQATGLIQNITSDRITDKVIRKMPTDEYLALLKLLDNIITGSINKKI